MKVALLLFFFCLVEADDLRWEFDALKNSMEEKLNLLERQNTEMVAKLTASETQMLKLQVEFLQIKLSSSDQHHQVHLLQSRLSSSENHVEALKQQSQEMAAKLSASEKELTYLQTKLSTTEHRVQVLQTKLSTTEHQVQVHHTRLSSSDNNVEALKEESRAHVAQLSTIETHLNATDNQVQELRNKTKVAFSAGLGVSKRVEFSSATTVVYKNVITNIGNAYNSTTGIFTSLLRGVYQFTFSAADSKSWWTYIRMYKNEQQIMQNHAYNTGQWESVSNAVILELQEGDRVYMKIPERNMNLHDNGNDYNHNMFSGFLLYPM